MEIVAQMLPEDDRRGFVGKPVKMGFDGPVVGKVTGYNDNGQVTMEITDEATIAKLKEQSQPHISISCDVVIPVEPG